MRSESSQFVLFNMISYKRIFIVQVKTNLTKRWTSIAFISARLLFECFFFFSRLRRVFIFFVIAFSFAPPRAYSIHKYLHYIAFVFTYYDERSFVFVFHWCLPSWSLLLPLNASHLHDWPSYFAVSSSLSHQLFLLFSVFFSFLLCAFWFFILFRELCVC